MTYTPVFLDQVFRKTELVLMYNGYPYFPFVNVGQKVHTEKYSNVLRKMVKRLVSEIIQKLLEFSLHQKKTHTGKFHKDLTFSVTTRGQSLHILGCSSKKQFPQKC